jgi:hypothetical protein
VNSWSFSDENYTAKREVDVCGNSELRLVSRKLHEFTHDDFVDALESASDRDTQRIVVFDVWTAQQEHRPAVRSAVRENLSSCSY